MKRLLLLILAVEISIIVCPAIVLFCIEAIESGELTFQFKAFMIGFVGAYVVLRLAPKRKRKSHV